MLLSLLAVASIVANTAYSQYRFNGQGLPADELYGVFSEYYGDFYPVWNSYLSEATTKYPDAYKQLTSLYGTTEFPENASPAQLSGFVSKIASVHETTIVDKDVNPSTLIFETPTGSTVEQVSQPSPTATSSKGDVSEEESGRSESDESAESDKSESTESDKTLDLGKSKSEDGSDNSAGAVLKLSALALGAAIAGSTLDMLL